MRSARSRVLGATMLATALFAVACGSGGGTTQSPSATDAIPTDTDPTEATSAPAEPTEASESEPDTPPEGGPTIIVGSFGFAESEILGEIYAQALDAAGYTVETNLALGTREEAVFPALTSGDINFVPEYIGGALGAGFGEEDLPGDPAAGAARLAELFEPEGVTVLPYAPGQDADAFVMTGAKADELGVTTIADLSEAGDILFGGPSECEERITCFRGLQEIYGLTNVTFQAIDDGGTRIESLKNDEIQLALLFSTQPVISVESFVLLEDPEGLVPAQNIVPVVRTEVVDAYGEEFEAAVQQVTDHITTEALIELNRQVEIDLADPADVAAQFLTELGITG